MSEEIDYKSAYESVLILKDMLIKENQQLKEINKELISVLKIVEQDVNFVELCDGYLVIEILDKVKEWDIL